MFLPLILALELVLPLVSLLLLMLLLLVLFCNPCISLENLSSHQLRTSLLSPPNLYEGGAVVVVVRLLLLTPPPPPTLSKPLSYKSRLRTDPNKLSLRFNNICLLFFFLVVVVAAAAVSVSVSAADGR